MDIRDVEPRTPATWTNEGNPGTLPGLTKYRLQEDPELTALVSHNYPNGDEGWHVSLRHPDRWPTLHEASSIIRHTVPEGETLQLLDKDAVSRPNSHGKIIHFIQPSDTPA